MFDFSAIRAPGDAERLQRSVLSAFSASGGPRPAPGPSKNDPGQETVSREGVRTSRGRRCEKIAKIGGAGTPSSSSTLRRSSDGFSWKNLGGLRRLSEASVHLSAARGLRRLSAVCRGFRGRLSGGPPPRLLVFDVSSTFSPSSVFRRSRPPGAAFGPRGPRKRIRDEKPPLGQAHDFFADASATTEDGRTTTMDDHG